MKNLKLITFVSLLAIFGCKDKTEKTTDMTSEPITDISKSSLANDLIITPLEHATMILQYKDVIFYVDPVGGSEKFDGKSTPNFILITDIHGDHLNNETLQGLDLSMTTLIAPKAVVDQLSAVKAKEIVVLNNGENKKYDAFSIEAIPMYNLREEALKFHEKGRGNGYVLQFGEERIYISGDTEDIPEMRSLENIDIAFVCMNLPYTMPVENAASAVLEFKPKKVYPYHYRGTDGLSDVDKFKSIINKENPNIEVVQLNWYL